MPKKITQFALISVFATTHSLTAQDYSALAGTWRETYVETPSKLEKTTESGQLVDTFFRTPFDAGTDTLEIRADGSYTGGNFSGRIIDLNRGRILFRDNGVALSETGATYMNASQDVIVVLGDDPDEHELAIFVKEPTFLQTSDLEGEWGLATGMIAASLQESYFNTDTNQSRSDDNSGYAGEFGNQNELLTDLFFTATDLESQFETVNISDDGALTGNGFSGTMTPNGVQPRLSVDGETITFSINASKDVMLTALREIEDDEIELLALIKKPSSINLSDLEGTWRLSSLFVPRELTETYYNHATMSTQFSTTTNDFAQGGYQLVDAFYEYPFETEQGTFEIDAAGNTSGLLNGNITVNGREISYSDSEGAVPMFINESLDFGVVFEVGANETIYNIITKIGGPLPEVSTPKEAFVQKVDLRLISDGDDTGLIWNGGNDLMLVGTTSLGAGDPSTWEELDETAGDSLHVPNAAGGNQSEFYVIRPRPDEE